jgi:transcriptional regulator with XRE-family HTH domain
LREIPCDKAARALLGWSQMKLADEAGIDLITLSRLEVGERYGAETVSIIQAVLERVGVEFPDHETVRFKSGAVRRATWDPPPI